MLVFIPLCKIIIVQNVSILGRELKLYHHENVSELRFFSFERGDFVCSTTIGRQNEEHCEAGKQKNMHNVM